MLYALIFFLGAAALLSALGFLPYRPQDIIAQALLFAALCFGLNLFLARVARTDPNPESSLITGLILACIAGPLSLPGEWAVLLVMAAGAMVSKYVFVWNRSHIFNPAAFGAVASALLLSYPASWWIGSMVMMPVILAGGLIISRKIRRAHLVLSFLGVYAGLLALDALVFQGTPFQGIFLFLTNILAYSPILFFSFVMLVEPLTSPQTRQARVSYGMLVGAVLFLLQRFAASVPFSLEAALLMGNVFARVLNPDFRQAFVLQKKERADSVIGSFWFDPTRTFSFLPGQFLEYTLAHPNPDSRGVRRYFTIASSPTEPRILLATKFAEKGSTFKRALAGMREGSSIKASKVAGNFILPPDPAKKLAFIAGGIGITPFRSMVQYLLDTKQVRDIVLLYGEKQEENFVFQDVFQKAKAQFGMKIVYHAGLLDARLIQREIPDIQDRVFYVSGPESMVESLGGVLSGLGVPKERIKQDFFPGYE